MVRATDIVTSLALLCLTRTGVHGADAWLLSERPYDITYPCEGGFGEVCFYMWQIRRDRAVEYVAIVSNGELQKAVSEDNDCTVQFSYLTEEDVGHRHCQQRNNDLSSHVAPEMNNTATLQCVFLPYIEQGHCYTTWYKRVGLTWVDEAGTAIQEDAQHHIKHQSPCEITLTVSLQAAESKTFRCQAAVDGQTQTSPKFAVGASDRKQSGRGFQIETAAQGGLRYVVWGAAGLVACVVSTAALAIFVRNKSRTNNQPPDEPSSVQHTSNNALKTDDVTYADICFSAGSEGVWVHECESTEYACVRYN